MLKLIRVIKYNNDFYDIIILEQINVEYGEENAIEKSTEDLNKND